MSARLRALRELAARHGADAVLLSAMPDIRWACGFTGSNGLLFVAREDAVFVSDGRYAEQARREVVGAEVATPGYDLIGFLAAHAPAKASAVIVMQADHLTFAQYEEYAARLEPARPAPVAGLLRTLVARKEAAEVALIRAAQRITEAVFEETLALLRPGLTEREVAAEIVYRHLRRGGEGMSFDPIVASGPNAALPHARPTDRALAAGDMVVLDFGCTVGGYASDMTRTVAVGEPGALARRVYATVLEAQEQALEAARAGMTAGALDAAARGVIERAGWGPQFSHSLGHGVGLQIHEWPRVGKDAEEILPEGAVVTIEPGIYLAGQTGVRIEDMVWLHADGCERLTAAPKALVVV